MMPNLRRRPRAALSVLCLLPTFAAAQGIGLSEALERADREGYSARLESERTREARGRATASLAGFLPTVRAEVGAAATDEPLSAFATRLGQRRVSMASFDPALLNDPSVIGGWNAALVAEVPLVNLDAWSGAVAARRAVSAQEASERAARFSLHAEVVEAWHGVAVAQEAVATWEAGREAVSSHEARARSAFGNGMLSRSDLLLAQVRLSETESGLSRARADLELARGRLALLLGSRDPGIPARAPEMTDSDLVAAARALPDGGSSPSREAAERGASAASADLSRARAAFLPRVNGMARLDWKGHETPWQEDASWTVGVVASWTLLRGGADWGEAAQAQARAGQARVGLEARTAQDGLEARSERARLRTALERLAIAARSGEQALEAERAASRSRDEGIAPLSDVLDARAAVVRARLEHGAARQEAVAALARLSLLSGRDPADLARALR